MIAVKFPVALSATFIWIGFIGAISFMESWLKFKAPGVTLPLGLGIGRLVFGALNKVEWVLAIAILLNLMFSKESILTIENCTFFLPALGLIIQTAWLLPALDARAQAVIGGTIAPPSTLHYWYVGIEIIKIISLIAFGISLLKR